MPRINYDQSQRDTAFHIWRESGQNVSAALRRLDKEFGLPLARPTLYDWMEQYEWQDRAARLDAEERRTEAARLTGRAKTLADLARLKDRYDRYFERLDAEDQIDNAATTAYGGLCRIISTLQKDLEAKLGDKPAAELGLGDEELESLRAGILGVKAQPS